MAEIVRDHVTKRYPDGAAPVKDLSLTIADGEFVILVRTVRMRKVHHAQHDCRHGGHHLR